MSKVIPGPISPAVGRDGVPLPKSTLHHWWLRNGIVLCTAGFVLSLALMATGTWMELMGLPHPEEYQRWGL